MRTLFLIALAATAWAAGDGGLRAALEPPATRLPAPELAVKDSAGKTLRLKKYRGKVVLLDFWATWCHGCKQEIPWFVEMQKTYRRQGLAVVGVSLDDDGWKVLRPFLAQARIPYRMALGDDATAKLYRIDSMPDAFLIDRQGRVAAVYRGGIVDRDNLTSNLQSLLAKPQKSDR